MAVSLKHTFVSAIPDGADASVVRPSNWNAEHTLTGTINTLMGFDATGASQSVTVGSGLTYSAGTITATGDGSGTVTSVAALTLGTSGTDLASTVANGTTTPVITLNVPTASATNRGVLSSTDWTTFNNKGSGTITSVTATAPVVSTGGTTPVISMAAATASVNGYLTSADWTTFNNKGSGSVTSVSGSGGTTGLTLTGGPITTTGTLTLGGTLAAANGGTGITSLGTGVATFLGTPSSANLAAAVTDETGSGALVFGTTPTFTTNITAPLVIGGTAVSSSLTLQSTSGVGSSDFVAFKTGSQVERMRITTAGDVGIGTTVPGAKLAVSNNAVTPPAPSSTGTALQLSGVDGTNNRIWMDAFAASNNITFRASRGTAAAPTATLNTNILGFLSCVGYGTTGYSSGSSGQIRFNATQDFTDTARGTSIDFYTTPNGSTTSANRMIIDQSGNVGIGTSTPTGLFNVQAAADDCFLLRGHLNLTDGCSIYSVNSANNTFKGMEFGASKYNFAGGSVGIGVTAPAYQIELSSDSAGKPGVGGLWTVVSDERIKSDIVPANLDRCYEIVKSVPLKYFGFSPGVYTDDQIKDKHNLGWIAQDVQKVFKNAVSVKPFTLKTDIPDGVEEYEEQDFTLETVEKTETEIQIIDGKPVQVSKVVTSENKVLLFDTVDVVDEAGVVVLDGDKPLTYQMPRMVTKTRPKVRHDVIEDCLDLNGGQMIAALYGAVQALMAKVEAMTPPASQN